jgi:hypothetical protein
MARRDTELTNRSVTTQVYLNPHEVVTETCCGIMTRHSVKEVYIALRSVIGMEN